MPKNKTHSGTKKRFRLTGSGKVMREQANRRHLFDKPSKRTRALALDVEASSADVKRVSAFSASSRRPHDQGELQWHA